jgi:TolB-like protein/Tfp pilus assembly protein PilF
MLLEFPSATAALRCAIEVQREMGTRNATIAEDERIDFRIGINLGDIIVDGDDIIGDGVNVAARLEPLAAPGGICVSASVREQVHDDLGVGYVDAGAQRVKNISKPVHMYRIALGGGLDREPPPLPFGARWPVSGRPLIAILAVVLVTAGGFAVWRTQQPVATNGPSPYSVLIVPFEVTGGDSALAAQAPKLTAEVGKALGDGIRIARVTPAALAATLAAKTKDATALGLEANVRYILEVGLRTEGEQIALTLRLVDAQDGRQLGSLRRNVDRSLDGDIRPLVRNVTVASRNLFGKAITDADAVAGGGPNPTARQLAARASRVDYRTDPEAADKEKWRLLDAAIKADPQLAYAWQQRAIAWGQSLDDPELSAADRAKFLANAEADSARAVELDADDPVLWLTRGWVLEKTGNVVAADAAYQRSLDLDPTQASPLLMRAGLAMDAGDPEEALRRLDIARKAYGTTPFADNISCHANLLLGNYETAIRDCERAALARDGPGRYVSLIAAYALSGDAANAARTKEKLLKAEPGFTIRKWEAEQPNRTAKVIELESKRLVAGLRKAGVPE